MEDDKVHYDAPVKSEASEEDRDDDFELTAEMLIHGNVDDEGTLEEEEMLEELEVEGSSGELNDLQKEGEMPLDELLAMYGYTKAATDDTGEDGRQLTSSLEPEIGSSASFARRDQQLRLEETEAPTNISGSPQAEENWDDEVKQQDNITGDKQVTRRSMRLLDMASTGNVFANWLEGDSDDDDDYCGYDSWKKDVKIGKEYQAEVSDTVSAIISDPITAKEALLWKPNLLSDDKITYFLNMANKLADEKGILPGGSLNRDNEMALLMLQECRYNVSKALDTLTLTKDSNGRPQLIGTAPKPWSEAECQAFELGLRMHGKRFHLIQKQIPQRSVGELVHFYYLWKKTERHDLFAQQARLGKKKYLFQPGKFQDYMQKHLDDLVAEADDNMTNSGRRADDEVSSNTSDMVQPNSDGRLDSDCSSDDDSEYRSELILSREKKRRCDPASSETLTEKKLREN